MIPPNGAIPQATGQYQKNHQKELHADKKRCVDELQISALALGTYLGNYDDSTDRLYEQALIEALNRGCNFIDTAINYRCQRSERTIGRVLATLISQKIIKRNQILIATKGGFIPFEGTPPTNLQAYIKKNLLDTGLVDSKDIVSSCHCLHPAFIQTQIDQSLQNLGVDTIDLYYLHNPEIQLPVVGPEVFYDRLYRAFCLLEENISKGKIQYYGLATWTAFREPSGYAESVNLDKLVELAQRAGGDQNHFKVIQLPYNLAMLEAISIHNQNLEDKSYPIIPVAGAYGINVMVSAPLLQSQLINLPVSVSQRMPGDMTMAQKALQFVISTPGVTAAMVGMKQAEHVVENLQVLGTSNWDLKTLEDICQLIIKK